MNFLDAHKESQRTGKPIKRKTHVLYGIIINKMIGTVQIIAKYVSKDNVYPLDLEDILANDWQVEGRDER